MGWPQDRLNASKTANRAPKTPISAPWAVESSRNVVGRSGITPLIACRHPGLAEQRAKSGMSIKGAASKGGGGVSVDPSFTGRVLSGILSE